MEPVERERGGFSQRVLAFDNLMSVFYHREFAVHRVWNGSQDRLRESQCNPIPASEHEESGCLYSPEPRSR